jgi:hypothetical protein
MGLARVQQAEAQGSGASTRSVSSAKASITVGAPDRETDSCFRWLPLAAKGLGFFSVKANRFQLGQRVERHRLPRHGANGVVNAAPRCVFRDRTGPDRVTEVALVPVRAVPKPRIVQRGIDAHRLRDRIPVQRRIERVRPPATARESCVIPSSSPR